MVLYKFQLKYIFVKVQYLEKETVFKKIKLAYQYYERSTDGQKMNALETLAGKLST